MASAPIERIIKAAVERGASDLHMKAGDLFRARIDQPIDVERDKVQGIVDTAVTEMFQKYPTKAGKK